MQRGLTEANGALFVQKEKNLKLQAENDSLVIQEMEDRKRIQNLLALTQPVTEEVTFFRDCRPGRMTRFPVQHAENNTESAPMSRSNPKNSVNIVHESQFDLSVGKVNTPTSKGDGVKKRNNNMNVKQVAKQVFGCRKGRFHGNVESSVTNRVFTE